MTFALGFGTTESAFEAAEIATFKELCASEYRRLNCSYVTDDLAESCSRNLLKRGLKYRNESDANKTSETHPERYSYFWETVLSDASHIVAIFRFSHINRRHALSPDGWAMLNTESVVIALRATDMPLPEG